ncbi:hypothetical protein D5S17_29035 [Pseudonocardiaceae bacterium YIM PH 21723]|nr:hypothetical protein D5S17_29035 [Pseudonocardiaceae bacterium YIM PH 21723]
MELTTMNRRTIAPLFVTVLAVLAACTSTGTDPAGDWVISSTSYSGQRGGTGLHYATCTPPGDPAAKRHVVITEQQDHADTDQYDTGKPCPAGPRLTDDQLDELVTNTPTEQQ